MKKCIEYLYEYLTFMNDVLKLTFEDFRFHMSLAVNSDNQSFQFGRQQVVSSLPGVFIQGILVDQRIPRMASSLYLYTGIKPMNFHVIFGH